MTLPACSRSSGARRYQSISGAGLRQSCCCALASAADMERKTAASCRRDRQTDGRMDERTPDRYIDSAPQWRRNYGDRGVHCTPPSLGLVPPVPPSQRCGLCQNFKQTTLTTRLYKVRTYLYLPHLRNRSYAPAVPHTTRAVSIIIL